MKIAPKQSFIAHLFERRAVAARLPWPPQGICQDDGAPTFYLGQSSLEITVQRHECRSQAPTLVGGDLDGVRPDMRPSQPLQVTRAQTGASREVDDPPHFGWGARLERS